jgi:hypothetical protein
MDFASYLAQPVPVLVVNQAFMCGNVRPLPDEPSQFFYSSDSSHVIIFENNN